MPRALELGADHSYDTFSPPNRCTVMSADLTHTSGKSIKHGSGSPVPAKATSTDVARVSRALHSMNHVYISVRLQYEWCRGVRHRWNEVGYVHGRTYAKFEIPIKLIFGCSA